MENETQESTVESTESNETEAPQEENLEQYNEVPDEGEVNVEDAPKVEEQETDFDFDSLSEEQLDELLADLEVPEEKEGPELPDKFNNVDDLVKSYKMLESKIGSFKGAPDEYTMEDHDMESPVMSGLADTAKELNMSNEAFNQFVGKYESIRSDMNDLEMREEMGKLGKNAEGRINSLNQQIDANMNEHQAEVLRNMATSADNIAVIEQLLQGRQSTPTTMQTSSNAPTDSEIQAMLFAKNENGQLKMEVDSAYADKVNRLTQNSWS